MSCYSHLTIKERESLMLFREKGKSIREIARELGRAPSTISRELRRNEEVYRASTAQMRYHEVRRRCRRHRILQTRELHTLVYFLLSRLYWSPEQISHRLALEGSWSISTSTIYRALETGELQNTLRYYLRIKYKKLGKNKEPHKVCFQKSIDLRPRQHPRLPVKSITFDQGSEFTEGEAIERALNTEVFFAHPHSPWERPTNENTNGLIRQFVPKRSKVSSLSDSDVDAIVSKLNFRPRKCLGWKTPYEVAYDQLLHLT